MWVKYGMKKGLFILKILDVNKNEYKIKETALHNM
jgi:hypothetical protein